MKAFQVVIDHVEEGILTGEYAVGSVLPPERELATQLGVGRSSVREAIRAMESQGVLDASVGAGPGSGTRVTSRHSHALTRLLKLHVALGKYPVDQVVDARVTLERGSASLAAEHASAAALARLAEMLEAMETSESIEEFSPLDTTFHVLIAEVGENQLVSDMTRAVREALLRPISEASGRLDNWADFRAGLVEQHRAIYDAIAARQPKLAADLMEAHIRHAYSILPMRGAAS